MNRVNGLTTQPCQHAVFNHLVIVSDFTELGLSACLTLDAGSSTQSLCGVSTLKKHLTHYLQGHVSRWADTVSHRRISSAEKRVVIQ